MKSSELSEERRVHQNINRLSTSFSSEIKKSMDLVGDYEINSEVVSPELLTFTEKTTTEKITTSTVQTTLLTTTQEHLIPLDEREKEILIFSLIGIIVVMGILLIICMCRRKRNAVDFEMNRIVAGSSTTLFDKNR